MNSVTGEPVPRAFVQIFAGRQLNQLTDSNGQFEFTSLPETQTLLIAAKPGYFNEQELNPSSPVPMSSVHIGPGTSPVVVKLVPHAVIYGRVVTDIGEPVEGIAIRMISWKIQEGRRVWAVQSANTDDDGRFRVPGLVPGAYYVESQPSLDYRAISLGGFGTEPAYPEVFYPGVQELADATPLDLGAGQQTEVNFSLKELPVVQVSGTIRGLVQGQGASLEIANPSGSVFQFPTRLDPETGKFHMDVPAGSYTLISHSQTPDGTMLVGRTPLIATSDIGNAQIVLGPAEAIPVVIRSESGELRPDPAVENNARRFLQSGRNINENYAVNVRLHSNGYDMRTYWGSRDERSGKSKELRILGVETGTYAAEIVSNSPWYVQSARCGNVDLLKEDLTVVSGSTDPINIVIRNDAAILRGTAWVGDHGAEGWVLAISENAPRLIKALSVNPDGQFEFAGLGPGDYSVLAFDRIDNLEFTNPQVLKPFLSRAAHATLSPNGSQEIRVELIHAEK